mmetsp:Transcript_1906/g.2114  ORF Transcript_1906/g.2114 Transcript_1906/m.2114 type:complete len:384 (-) Transcript_1906:325-1476(-)|eukprot:CAMPEP_0197859764 /NCGR_PEP_ID=MMETSP1438-20131217/34630_1 /TAXON_ID=1461541 /ORGANISM="Pterosperma sp., Strain CCMP1384" /LENGTH=383 /DNA_ID=CAMNT_0043476399 /DNA_START=306 /DNA_END=1457 /DNA_ORIENTATION=-
MPKEAPQRALISDLKDASILTRKFAPVAGSEFCSSHRVSRRTDIYKSDELFNDPDYNTYHAKKVKEHEDRRRAHFNEVEKARAAKLKKRAESQRSQFRAIQEHNHAYSDHFTKKMIPPFFTTTFSSVGTRRSSPGTTPGVRSLMGSRDSGRESWSRGSSKPSRSVFSSPGKLGSLAGTAFLEKKVNTFDLSSDSVGNVNLSQARRQRQSVFFNRDDYLKEMEVRLTLPGLSETSPRSAPHSLPTLHNNFTNPVTEVYEDPEVAEVHNLCQFDDKVEKWRKMSDLERFQSSLTKIREGEQNKQQRKLMRQKTMAKPRAAQHLDFAEFEGLQSQNSISSKASTNSPRRNSPRATTFSTSPRDRRGSNRSSLASASEFNSEAIVHI